MRLSAKQDLRTKQHEFAFANWHLGDGDAAFEMLLAPGPTTA